MHPLGMHKEEGKNSEGKGGKKERKDFANKETPVCVN